MGVVVHIGGSAVRRSFEMEDGEQGTRSRAELKALLGGVLGYGWWTLMKSECMGWGYIRMVEPQFNL